MYKNNLTDFKKKAADYLLREHLHINLRNITQILVL